jgi:4-hydroxybenzoate polyprenyltransferase
VLAYDTEYAMVDRDDDLKIGMKTSAITLGAWDVPAIMGFYAVYLGNMGLGLPGGHARPGVLPRYCRRCGAGGLALDADPPPHA